MFVEKKGLVNVAGIGDAEALVSQRYVSWGSWNRRISPDTALFFRPYYNQQNRMAEQLRKIVG